MGQQNGVCFRVRRIEGAAERFRFGTVALRGFDFELTGCCRMRRLVMTLADLRYLPALVDFVAAHVLVESVHIRWMLHHEGTRGDRVD